ncbi:hypothetical protein JVT61DRAFT_7872 [Boletus reticuloceps]|uniref:Uncharacterized protein n=1 Tax=Boletus reticuloceps TaxID=495285 RepID=A0A8I2YHK4_9AGAM|nr:hypothetical protein JVT61DRAFT_7872 [Boletus reticuloceps]
MVQTVRPVSEPAAPDGRFGYQVPPPVPTFVGSQSVTAFEQDRIANKAARSMMSTGGKTSGSNTQVFSDPRSFPTNGVHPPNLSTPRSHTPAPSLHGISVAPSSGRSSPLSDGEDENEQTGNQLWDIEEEEDVDDETGQQEDRDDEADHTRFSDMYEDGHAAGLDDMPNGGAMVDDTPADTGELYFVFFKSYNSHLTIIMIL